MLLAVLNGPIIRLSLRGREWAVVCAREEMLLAVPLLSQRCVSMVSRKISYEAELGT